MTAAWRVRGNPKRLALLRKNTNVRTTRPLMMAAAAAEPSSTQRPLPYDAAEAVPLDAVVEDTTECRSCMQLLKDVLLDPSSRPNHLLQAMMTTKTASLESQSQHDAIATAHPSNVPTSSHATTPPPQVKWREAPWQTSATSDQTTTYEHGSANDTHNTHNDDMASRHTSSSTTNSSAASTLRGYLEVQLPVTALNVMPRRRWSRLTPPSQLPDSVSTSHQLATSAVNQSSLVDTNQLSTRDNGDGSDPNNLLSVYKEWIQFSCKPCSDTGPEGGARAFVMVCTVQRGISEIIAETFAYLIYFYLSHLVLLFRRVATFIQGPQPLSIVVCTNRLAKDERERRKEMHEILTHELVHVYDVRHLQLDLRDCENLAYSEVRAARQAECASASDSWWSLQTQRSCVRHKALTATNNLFPGRQGYSCMQRVFDTAFQDTRPIISPVVDSTNQSTMQPPPTHSSNR